MTTEKFAERFLTSYDLGKTVVKKEQGSNNEGKILKVNTSGLLVLANDNNTTYSAGDGLELDDNNVFSLEELTQGSSTLTNNVMVDKHGRVTGLATIPRQLADYQITDGWEMNNISTIPDNADLGKIWRGTRDGEYGLWVVMERESVINS